MVGDVDVVVVAGTGALETSLRIPVWGLPYWIFLIAVMCRLRGKKLLILSVGAENPVDPVKRFFFRWTMRMADYCSFRDEKSLAAARAMGVRKKLDGVFPDLAFALPTPPAQDVRPGHVTIGVMTYTGRADERFPIADRHARYVVHMTSLVERLLDAGGTVTMVIGDRADLAAGEEILQAVKTARPSAGLCLQNSADLGEVMDEMAHAEVVVASRFHSVICGLKMAKPTVSLGYANKHADLTTRFGLAEFNLSLDDPDVETLLCHIAEARSRTPELEPRMTEVLGQFRAELGNQFALISTEFLGGREQSGLASGGSRC
jgi:polysaccharide pyruvyl transferase WcaK-like protein